ncbi:MAG: hypothetical protein KatS3mg088_341 [Patescibacteria group bacterium]|nr:MAG: hypothetical protein KatS3mg088_341 [Patescibacteria group bacterium]
MTAEFKKGGPKTEANNQILPKEPKNGSKPVLSERKPEYEKRHIKRDGKKQTPGVS